MTIDLTGHNGAAEHGPDCNCAQDDRDAPELTHIDGWTGEVLDEDAPVGSGWDAERHCATDLRGADWAGRKLREAQEQLVRNLEMVQGELEELRLKEKAVWERLERADAPFRKTAAFMENALRVFAETHREEVLKGLPKDRKSRLLPSGVRIGWRRVGGNLRRIEGDDGAALLAWAKAKCPSAVVTKEGVDVAAVKLHAVAFEVVPPGMERPPVTEELRIETGVPGVESKEES